MSAAAARGTRRRPSPPPMGNLREIVMLLAGAVTLIVGLVSRPQDPATIGIGVALLTGTPIAAASRKDDDQ